MSREHGKFFLGAGSILVAELLDKIRQLSGSNLIEKLNRFIQECLACHGRESMCY